MSIDIEDLLTLTQVIRPGECVVGYCFCPPLLTIICVTFTIKITMIMLHFCSLYCEKRLNATMFGITVIGRRHSNNTQIKQYLLNKHSPHCGNL